MQQLWSEGCVGGSMQHKVGHVVVAVTSQQRAAKVLVKGLCAQLLWLGCGPENIYATSD